MGITKNGIQPPDVSVPWRIECGCFFRIILTGISTVEDTMISLMNQRFARMLITTWNLDFNILKPPWIGCWCNEHDFNVAVNKETSWILTEQARVFLPNDLESRLVNGWFSSISPSCFDRGCLDWTVLFTRDRPRLLLGLLCVWY